MDQSNDDLQSAINGIVAGNADANAAPASDAPAAGAEMPDLGVPPTPPVPTGDAGLDMTLPNVGGEAPTTETPAPEPGADLMNQDPAPIEEQAAADTTSEAPAPGPAPEAPIEAPAETPAEAPAPETTPEINPTAPATDLTDNMANITDTQSNELSSVKQSMIQDLIPLMDKVSLEADKKFDLYKEVIDSTHDKNMVPAAYEAAKGISDDTAKAEALLYLINESE